MPHRPAPAPQTPCQRAHILQEELTEELGEDVQDEVEDTDWGPHEDSAPSTEEYSSQSEEECDGIDSSNTVR